MHVSIAPSVPHDQNMQIKALRSVALGNQGGLNSSTFIFFLKIIVDLCETSFYASDLPYRRNLSGSSHLSNIFGM